MMRTKFFLMVLAAIVMILPCSQVCTQLAAGSLNILIRCLVADQTLTVEHLCAITLCTLDPVAHPLAVAPARICRY